MQVNPEGALCKEVVLDLTTDSDDEFVKQENISDDGFDHNCTISSCSNKKGNFSSSPVEETTQLTDFQRSKSIRNFDQTLEKAIIVIKKGGSLDATAVQFGIPKDVIYKKLTSRSLPKETDILTSAEEFNLVQWILRANKNNSIVLKNDLLFKVGKMKKVANITPIFAKSKFGKMWYDHFMQRYPEIYDNDGILMPSEIGFQSSSHASSSNQNLSKTSTDLEENQLVEWVLEMNRQNKLVFKHDLLEKVRKLRKLSPMFVKSEGRKWYKLFLKNHPEVYENEELLMPSASIYPKNHSRELENNIPLEPFPTGPLKLKKDIAKQLHILGFKKALVILHDCRQAKYLQILPKNELEPVLSIQSKKVLSREGSVPKEENCIKRSRTLTNEENCSGSSISGEDFDVKTENNSMCKKMKSGAEEADRYMCTKCNKTLSNKSKLERHLTSHIPKNLHKFECAICYKRFASKYHVSVHLKLAHSDNVYHCGECDRVFKHNTSLRKHKRTIHLDKMEGNVESTSYICDICEKRFNYKKSLKDHIIYGHLLKKKKYPCSICRKRFIKYSLMLRHKLRHVKTKPFACNNCTKSFSRKYLLREHSKQCKNNHKQSLLGEEDCEQLSIEYVNKLDLD